jgi:hypothetical protein
MVEEALSRLAISQKVAYYYDPVMMRHAEIGNA